jgi:uncharacterized protein
MAPRFERVGPSTGSPLLIQGYSSGGYRVRGEIFAQGLLITPLQALAWTPPPLDQLTPDLFAVLQHDGFRAEVFLLGTGPQMTLPPRAIRDALSQAGLPFDVMDSRAAARTFNLLIGENRQVAAAFYNLSP